MSNILNISVQIDTPLKLLGLLIIAIVVVSLAVLAKQVIVYIGACILKYHKVNVKVDKDDFHTEVHLRQ